MSGESGIVQDIDDKWAWVKTERKSMCDHCGHRSHCQVIEGGDSLLVKALNTASAKKGDRVELFLSTKTKMKCALIAYMAPVFGLMIGAFSSAGLSALIGLNPKIGMVLFSFTGVALAFLLARQYSKRMEMKGALTPLVYRIRRRSGI